MQSKIKVLSYTNNPLTTMGHMAGICYGTTKENRYIGIAKRCLEEGHDRVSEFPTISLEITCSAKLAREVYTHIIGTTRLQASTRYIDYSRGFKFITPPSILESTDREDVWNNAMDWILKSMQTLESMDVPVEDLTNLLPLAYETTFVMQINLRALIHMFHVRSCRCAYWEYRHLMDDLSLLIKGLGFEWNYIANNYFVPKCVPLGYCQEKTRCCGFRSIKTDAK